VTLKSGETMKDDLTLSGIVGVVIVVTTVMIGILLMAASFTILSLNVLFAAEIIPLTWTTVFALAWVKFWIGIMISGVIKVKKV
jgi:hypothetical protein